MSKSNPKANNTDAPLNLIQIYNLKRIVQLLFKTIKTNEKLQTFICYSTLMIHQVN
jgi:hypothetical protein